MAVLRAGFAGAQGRGVEGGVLGPDARVYVADHDALAGFGGSAEGLPQSRAAGESEEVGGVPVVGGVVEAVGGDVHDVPGVGEAHQLASVEPGAEGVGGDRVVLADGGADLLGDAVLLVRQVGAVPLGGGRCDIELAALGGLRGGEVTHPAVVGDQRLVGEGDQVGARGGFGDRGGGGNGGGGRGEGKAERGKGTGEQGGKGGSPVARRSARQE
ncbi:hypothetical protein [Streptomyces zhihengii]|uniref:hypothetical protein n=1 Tax=Streptomyces zhihengii TaxID=1818004 RepID=UPI001FD60EF5|nr:hypothetical protein [Streptomyces zhihengii]